MEVQEQRQLLDRWYGYMKNQQQEQADTQKQEIEDQSGDFTDPDLKRLYELFKVRYYLMYDDLENSAKCLADTGLVQDDKYHWLNYYYYFFRGIYHYTRQEYKTAIEWYTKARLFIADIPIEETAELFYKLAAACNRSYQISLSIQHAERALEIFKEHSHFKRISGCESLLGLNNYDIDQYKEAEQHYQEALIYVEKADDSLLKLRILHNLGYLYSEKNEPKKALDYLNQVKQLLETEIELIKDNYLKTQNSFLLCRSYFETDQPEKAKEALERGLALSKDEGYEDYEFHLNLLKTKFMEPSHFEEVYSEGITFFKEHDFWEYVIEYSEELASYLRGTGNHEKAVEYFSLAVDARNKMKKERALFDDQKTLI